MTGVGTDLLRALDIDAPATGPTPAIVVEPGMVAADLDVDGEIAHATLATASFPPAAWESALDALAERPALAEQVLAGELPPAVCDLLARAGVPLVPTAEEVRVGCSVHGASGCTHSLVLMRELGRVLDSEPLLLATWRGQPRTELVAGLVARRSRAALEAVTEPPADPDLPDDRRFWRAGPRWHGPASAAPGRSRPDALLLELGSPPAIAGGDIAAERLRELYRTMATDATDDADEI